MRMIFHSGLRMRQVAGVVLFVVAAALISATVMLATLIGTSYIFGVQAP